MAVAPVFTPTLDLSDYLGLKNAVSAYLNRPDLNAQIPAFIQQHEAKMNRELRVREMLTRVEATVGGRLIVLPIDFLSHYTLRLADDGRTYNRPLDYVGENEAAIMQARQYNGHTRYYTIEGNYFELIPAPVETSPVKLLMTYYAKVPALNETRTTNWLLAKSPDMYLVGSCLEAQTYLKDDARLQTWASLRGAILDNMHKESEQALRSDTYLVARRRSF
jgi:hypothetical protein